MIIQIVVRKSIIKKHGIGGYSTALLTRTPFDTFWSHNAMVILGKFSFKIIVFLDGKLVKMTIAGPSLKRMPRVPGTREILRFYIKGPIKT